MKKYKTEQESFWANSFGDEYRTRNAADSQSIANRLFLWAEILRSVRHPLNSILELGANIGINLEALHLLFPKCRLDAVEINAGAASVLRKKDFINVFEDSILSYTSSEVYDLVFTSGVLIHINPDELDAVYQKMDKASQQYVCIAEYYNPSPVSIDYRGHENKLFKRDFAGEFLQRYPHYRLRDYGFRYHKDLQAPADDITWFLLEKTV